jgi:hypothetical protein
MGNVKTEPLTDAEMSSLREVVRFATLAYGSAHDNLSVDLTRVLATIDADRVRLAAFEKLFEIRDDGPLPEDAEIKAAFPTRTGQHEIYGEAMRMVSAKRTKASLVELVNWLLARIAEMESEKARAFNETSLLSKAHARAEIAEAKVEKLTADAAAMRKALEKLAHAITKAGDWDEETRVGRALNAATDAVIPEAGVAMLAELEALRKVASAARDVYASAVQTNGKATMGQWAKLGDELDALRKGGL